MIARRRISAFLLLAIICFLAACGGSSHSSQSASGVSIQLMPPPSVTSLPVGNTTGTQFNPVVSNDPNQYGVDWAVTCSQTGIVGACGTLSIPTFHSASGTPVTYTPPTFLYTGTLVVNITVFATADHTQNVTTPITITSYANVLNSGTAANYVLQVQGSDSTGAPYQMAGAFTFDSNPNDASYGTITGGEETLNTIAGYSASYCIPPGSSPPSTYSIGPDGRGTITLNLQQIVPPQTCTSGGTALQETFSLVVISSSKVLIAELDGVGTATGTLELQTATALMLPASYAFVASGVDSGGSSLDKNGPMPIAFGGVVNIDSSGNISGASSEADENYDKKLINCPASAGITGTVSGPDSFGAVTIDFSGQPSCQDSNANPATFDPTILVGYIVDANHIRLLENDDTNGTSGFLTGGLAIGQGSPAGTFNGSYVFGILGANVPTSNNPALTPSSLTSAGVLNADSSTGSLSGYTDTFLQADSAGPPASVSSPFSNVSYQTDSLGRVAWNLAFTGPMFKPNFGAYLDGDGTPLVLYGEITGTFLSVGAGIAYPQAAPPLTFGGGETYGVSFTLQSGTENDGTGQMTSSPYNGQEISLSGTVDDLGGNDFPSGNGTPIAFTEPPFTPTNINGMAGIITGGTFLFENGGGLVNYYFVDPNQGFFIETDLATSSQVGLGYFAQACDVTSSTSCQVAAGKPFARRASKWTNSRNLNKRK